MACQFWYFFCFFDAYVFYICLFKNQRLKGKLPRWLGMILSLDFDDLWRFWWFMWVLSKVHDILCICYYICIIYYIYVYLYIYICIYIYIYIFDFHILCITYVYRWVCDYKTHAWCFQRFLVALWSLFFMFWHELITVLIPVKLFSFIHYGSVSFPKVCDVQPTDSYTQNNNYKTNQQCQW